MTERLTPELFAQYRIGGKAIVIAASGGGDSMALLDLYRFARSQNEKLPAPNVVTVDHGLRQGFAREATIVKAYCSTHNLPWRLLCWEGDKPKTGIMAAARLARYRLLAGAALDVGANFILTGHTLDDQNETAIMRDARGLQSSSPMESDVLFERCAVISRPLLTISRAELRAHLAANDMAFADDPTNVDMRFERARVRGQYATINALPESFEAREASVQRAAYFIAENVKREGDHILILRPQIRIRDAEILALRYLAATLGHFDYPAPAAIGERLAGLLDAGHNGVAFTAQRCRFVRIDGGISVVQEWRHLGRPWLNALVSPFEMFCAKSMLPLANALAKLMDAKAFLMP